MSQIDISLPEDDVNLVQEIMSAHSFGSLKKTQEIAFKDGVLEEGNHLLIADTGNGKTLCAEAVTKKTIDSGGTVAYLVPSLQLVRDKKETIQEWADATVKTAPRGYNDADVVVATFDSFYRAILNGTGNSQFIDTVILDDFHELYGGFRGPAIEKAIGAIQEQGMKIFAMSATIGNPDEIGEWLNARVSISPEGREIQIVEEAVEQTGGSKKEAIADFIAKNSENAPFLIFNYAKSWTESRAQAIADKQPFGRHDESFVQDIESRVDGEMTDTMEELAEMIRYGVAFHHSDLPNSVKELIENLYYEDVIQCLCSTTTIAYGFDAPVQTVVVGDVRRGPEPVGVWEYTQWIGRAARPGYGYDEGYAYTITKHPEEVADRYFEPRTLEPVETHFESDEAFRQLVIELIDRGWRDPKEIVEFIQGTLYWTQMTEQSAWGEPLESKEEQLKRRLKQTIYWLTGNDFVREKHTTQEFQTTTLGEATVEFLFNTFGSYRLDNIKQFYTWVKNNEPTQFETLHQLCRIFDITISQIEGSQKLEREIVDQGFPVDEYSRTAGVINLYWAENYHLSDIERNAGVKDATSLPPTAKNVAETLKATKFLFEAAEGTYVPDWFEEYVYRVERGIRPDEYYLVRNVRNLGRKRIRTIRTHLMDTQIPALSKLADDAPLAEYLYTLYNEAGESKFKDVLRGQKGIGPKTATRITNILQEKDLPTDVTRNKPDHTIEKTDKSRSSTLDEF